MKEKKVSTAVQDKIIAEVNKKYGENSLMRATQIPQLPAVPSGSLALDYTLGTGGLPPNRLIEVFGQESCGKTTLGFLAMRQFLDAFPNKFAMMLDLEHKTDPEWMSKLLGGEQYMERVLYAQPDHVEQGTNMYVDMLSTGRISFCLFDSVGGAATKASMEKDAEKQQVGGNAPQITKFARLAGNYSAKYECLTFCVNQIREDMEGYHRNMSPGGKALKHHAIARIFVRKSPRETVTEKINGQDLVVGNRVFATMVKNHLGGIEGAVANWWFYNVETEDHEFGIDTDDELFNLATSLGVIEGVGWYRHPAFPEDAKGERKVQGKAGIKALLSADEAVKKKIIAETMAALQDKPEAVLSVSGDEGDS